MTVGRWERGERLPHPDHRQKLCDLFEKNAQELGLLPEISEAPDDMKAVSAPPLQPPATNETTKGVYSQWHRHRRIFLIGLAGLGVTALAGGIWEATRSQSPSPVPPTHVLRKRFRQLSARFSARSKEHFEMLVCNIEKTA